MPRQNTWKKSMITLNHSYDDTSPPPFDWLARIASTVVRFWSRSRRARYVRLMSADLRALDDRMLKDIGLQRHRIVGLINGRHAEWYVPLADMDGTAAPTPQAHRAMPAQPIRHVVGNPSRVRRHAMGGQDVLGNT
jgi:uncharacterized protein YjiS (DUF1127 family)